MVPPIKWSYEFEIETDEQAAKIAWDLNKKEAKRLLDALNRKMWMKEEKEVIEKTPELADKNFRVEDTKGRKEIIDPNGVKVLENSEGNVREYVEGKYKWEQFFTDESALREATKAGKTLPPSSTTYVDIINKKYNWDYQAFITWEKMIFSGWRYPNNKTFYYIDRGFVLRCADGSYFNGHRNKWNYYEWNKYYGFSVRCLKD